jgi:hypothetical protein
MDSGPEKRCLLCGQMVPPNAVKCSACGKGRFETEKRHTEPRPARAGARSGANPGAASRPAAAAPSRPEAAAKAPSPSPRGGFLARLLGRLSGKE